MRIGKIDQKEHRSITFNNIITVSTYFATQLEVAHDNTDLGASDDENQKDQEQEAEQIIKLM